VRLLSIRAALVVVLGAVLTGCGYHAAGTTNLLPKDIHTIALTPWGNGTTQYKLSTYMGEALSRELIARTSYTVIADPAKADATVYASIANVFMYATGLGTGARVIVQMQIRMVGRDGKVLFNRPHMEFRDRYEISVDPKQYLDESQATMSRLSKDVARTVVAAMLADF